MKQTTENDSTPGMSDVAEINTTPAEDDGSAESDTKCTKKQLTPGVIYLSSIPEGMQYNDVYKVFSELGDIGRISLQIGGKWFMK